MQAPKRMHTRQFAATVTSMPSIQVKDVPDTVHTTLRQRAAASGKSLQEYLLERLTADAEQPTLDELFARVEHHTDGDAGFALATDAVRAERDNH